MLVIGKEYTRDDIHAHLGGSKQSYLPTVGGTVVAACLTKDLNPRAPQVILCGDGPRIITAGLALAESKNLIPVFVKEAVNRWKYEGRFKVKASYTSGSEFEEHIAGSGRLPSEVSCVVVLQEAADSCCFCSSKAASLWDNRDALMSCLNLEELEYEEPNLFLWKHDVVNDAEDVARFMYRGGWIPPQACSVQHQYEDRRPEKKYWQFVKEELHVFLCRDEERYRDLWQRIAEIEEKSSGYIKLTVAAYLGEKIGVPATLLGGFVAVALYSLLKLGKEAYCQYSATA